MPIEFTASERSSIGVEWELALVDRSRAALAQSAGPIVHTLEAESGTEYPRVIEEFLQNTVELASAPARRVAQATEDLAELVSRVGALTDAQQLDLVGCGTHPFSQWFDQRVTEHPRYRRFVDEVQWWGRQILVWGLHVHVGIEDREKAMPILSGLLTYLPHLLALSASSPYWAGTDTGYASNRALVFQQLPTSGLPYDLGSWPEYERCVEDLVRAGTIVDQTELRWDVRPSPRWGTVEMRICDAPPTLEEVAALTALTQCLVEDLSRRLDAGEPVRSLQPWFVRDNKWRTARHGLDAHVIVDRTGTTRVLADDVRDTIAALEPVARDLGCAAELASVLDLLEIGPSYLRQRRVADANGGNLQSVVASVVREFQEGPEGWPANRRARRRNPADADEGTPVAE